MYSCQGPFVQRTLLLHKPDNNWVSKQENKTSSKRRINVSLFTFPAFGGLDRKSGLGLWESLDFETERYQLKSSLEF